jgi:quercetin dioxygenase-like cupin family protein
MAMQESVRLACILTVAVAAGALMAEVGNETVREVFAGKLSNAPGQTLTAEVVEYPPGGKSTVHHHAGSVFAYVLRGSIRSQNSATGAARIYKTGESFFEPAGSDHLISENASSTEPAALLAVHVAPDGAGLTKAGHAKKADRVNQESKER